MLVAFRRGGCRGFGGMGWGFREGFWRGSDERGVLL